MAPQMENVLDGNTLESPDCSVAKFLASVQRASLWVENWRYVDSTEEDVEGCTKIKESIKKISRYSFV